jgi:hypothetical protein
MDRRLGRRGRSPFSRQMLMLWRRLLKLRLQIGGWVGDGDHGRSTTTTVLRMIVRRRGRRMIQQLLLLGVALLHSRVLIWLVLLLFLFVVVNVEVTVTTTRHSSIWDDDFFDGDRESATVLGEDREWHCANSRPPPARSANDGLLGSVW